VELYLIAPYMPSSTDNEKSTFTFYVRQTIILIILDTMSCYSVSPVDIIIVVTREGVRGPGVTNGIVGREDNRMLKQISSSGNFCEVPCVSVCVCVLCMCMYVCVVPRIASENDQVWIGINR
jgi:hypothetical protein